MNPAHTLSLGVSEEKKKKKETKKKKKKKKEEEANLGILQGGNPLLLSCAAAPKLHNQRPHISAFYVSKANFLGGIFMMKFKPNQTRTYDGEGYKRRAACLCFRNDKEDEVLLVSSSRHPDQWIVPGGGMEPEEEPCAAAVREVYEEAGVKGKLGRLLGIFEHNQDRKHRTYVYILIVTETLEDWEDSVNIGRKRKWFKVDEAIAVLQSDKPDHAQYLRELKNTCNPACSSTNGNNTLGSQVMDNNTPHCVVCATPASDLVNR